MGRLVFSLEHLDTPHHGKTWSWWGRERCSGQRQGLLTVRLWLTTSPALGSTWSTRWVCTRAPTCPLVTTLSPSLWCYLPTFPLRIFTFRVLLNNRETSCPDNLSLTQEVTGHTHTYSCLVGLLPPLHQVAKYWELWHQISKIFTLLPTKSVTGLLMSWLMILLSKYYTEETKPFNLYLLKKRISGSLWFICLCLVWSYQQVRTGQNCLDIFHYKWLYYWRKVRFAVIKSIQCRPLSLNCFRIRIEMNKELLKRHTTYPHFVIERSS